MKAVIRTTLCAGLLGFLAGCQPTDKSDAGNHPAMTTPTNESVSSSSPAAQATASDKVVKTEEEWRKTLTPDQYRVLRQAGTERAYGAAYEEFKKQGAGTYVCGGCGAELFSSKEKFDSHCGWPSFYDPANAKNVITHDDYSAGMDRTEVRCAKCDGHLGHVFKGEGFPTPTDKRYCINGVSLKFVPEGSSNSVGKTAPPKP